MNDALQLFADQFTDSQELQKLATALISPTFELETALEDLLANRWIDTAVGVQLDLLGEILGMERQGRSDAAYRAALRFQVFINVSKADPEVIIRATRELSLATVVRYWENYPAGFQVFTDGPNVLDVSGGVIETFVAVTDDTGAFELDDGSQLLYFTSYEAPQGLASFLKSVAPVAINTIAVTFSLGETPLFGFGGDFLSAYLTTDDNGDFILEDTGILELSSPEVAPSPDGYIGFSDFQLQNFVLDDGGDLELRLPVYDYWANVVVDIAGVPTPAPFYLDNGNYLVFHAENLIPDEYLANARVDIDGIPTLAPFYLDNGNYLLFYKEEQLSEVTTLNVFDQNQPSIGGGKLAEGMTDA